MNNYELAKKLKNAGFPVKEFEDHSINMVTGRTFDTPTLSELIEACDGRFNLNHFPDHIYPNEQWEATLYRYGNSNEGKIIVHGITPEEAVAHLWLALQDK